MTDEKHPLVDQAIRVCGSQEKLAERSGGRLSQSAISRMLLKQARIRGEDAVAIEVATDGAVPRHRLRPDRWPAPAPSEAA